MAKQYNIMVSSSVNAHTMQNFQERLLEVFNGGVSQAAMIRTLIGLWSDGEFDVTFQEVTNYSAGGLRAARSSKYAK